MFQTDLKNFKKSQPTKKTPQPTTAGIFSINTKEQRNLNYNGENLNYRKLGRLTQINLLLPPNQFPIAYYFAGTFSKHILVSQI